MTILQLYLCVLTSLVDCIWTRPFSLLSQNYRENLPRRRVSVYQKLWGKPTTFHSFISVWLCRWSQRKYSWSTGHSPCVHTAKGCCLGFLRNLSSFLMDLQNDWWRQQALLSLQVILSLPILSSKYCRILRNYTKPSSYQTQRDLLCQIDKPYYL